MAQRRGGRRSKFDLLLEVEEREPGVWAIGSLSRPGSFHEVRPDDGSCTCEAWANSFAEGVARPGRCWHTESLEQILWYARENSLRELVELRDGLDPGDRDQLGPWCVLGAAARIRAERASAAIEAFRDLVLSGSREPVADPRELGRLARDVIAMHELLDERAPIAPAVTATTATADRRAAA